ncbi:MAG: AAA family ATPase, partial [Planctomycetota bacterium]
MVDPLPAGALRWRCDPDSLPFESTDDVEPVVGVVGQTAAVEALRFGLECDARGQNIFVRGLVGTGRMTLVGRLLDELNPTCTSKQDRCYVHSFTHPDCPRLLSFPAGQARAFRRRLHELTEFIRTGLADTLNSEPIRVRREALLNREKEAIEKISKPFEAALKEAGLALVTVQVGEVTQPAIYPVYDGKPVAPEEYEDLHEEGKVTKKQLDAFLERSESYQRRLEEVSSRVREIHRTNSTAIRAVYEEMTRAILGELARSILSAFPGDTVKRYLQELIDDVAENQIVAPPNEAVESLRLYGVNIILEHEKGVSCPIVIENTPSLPNLLGQVERQWGAGGPEPSDYRMIRAGSLLRADGGYLVLDARDVLSEPGAWKVLIRTLRTGYLEIVPPEFGNLHWQPSLKPEPIPVQLRVILLGDAHTYYVLDAVDADFSHLFKVLADFDSVIERNTTSVEDYAGVLARIIKEESLLPMSRGAVAAIAEHGARIAEARGKLTARFSRIADIAREASFLAEKQGE